jgi:anti-sigma B factor antagonist
MTASSSKLQIAEQRIDDVTVLVLTGQMLLDDGDLAYRKKVHELIDEGRPKILVDLGGVTYIDSSGIGMMVAKLKTAREKKGDIKLLRLSQRTQHLLAMLKLVLVFEVFDDEAAAVRSFSWPGR